MSQEVMVGIVLELDLDQNTNSIAVSRVRQRAAIQTKSKHI